MKERAEYDELVEVLRAKYSAEPQKFRAYLPDVAQMLDRMSPPRRPSRSPFGLTVRERAFHQSSLAEILSRLTEDALSSDRAIKGLEHCATLIEDDSLPEYVRHDVLVKLLKSAIGKSPGTFKKNETIRIAESQPSEDVVNRVSLVRGVYLELDRESRLVSISVVPREVKERKKLLAIVGMIDDPVSDMSTRYEDYLYLPETDPHGRS